MDQAGKAANRDSLAACEVLRTCLESRDESWVVPRGPHEARFVGWVQVVRRQGSTEQRRERTGSA
jgi:hypothetical protein